MKKYITIIFLFSGLLILTASLNADPLKTITLKDGSTIKGEIVKFENNIYTVETPHLGEVKINDTEIKNINAGEVNPVQPFGGQNSGFPTQANNSPQLMNQVQQMQGSILTDPELMAEIQELMKDPSIMSIISDEKVVDDAKSFDVNRIGSNDKMKELMNNPKFHALMNKIRAKFSLQANH